MAITITADEPRTIKALEIAAGAGQWLKCRTAAGTKVYGVPSQRGRERYYLVTCSSCDCEDAQRHPSTVCKHQLAVRLHCELVRAKESQRATRSRTATASARYDEIFKRFAED